jgi:hypothetical protein
MLVILYSLLFVFIFAASISFKTSLKSKDENLKVSIYRTLLMMAYATIIIYTILKLNSYAD